MLTKLRQRLADMRPGRIYRTEAYQIPGFTGRYPLSIYLPPGYDDNQNAYPVAYMFDAQNIYGDEGSYSGGWHLDELIDKRARRGKVVPVVVGIPHGGATRTREMSPFPIHGHEGNGAAFLDWILGPVFARAALELRLLKGPENTMIGGSSLGGLMALYAYFRFPEVFGQVLSMSPSIWVDQPAMLKLAGQTILPSQRRVYIDAGAREGRTMTGGEAMTERLVQLGFDTDVDLMWRPDARGSHNEKAWARRLPKAMTFLYG